MDFVATWNYQRDPEGILVMKKLKPLNHPQHSWNPSDQVPNTCGEHQKGSPQEQHLSFHQRCSKCSKTTFSSMHHSALSLPPKKILPPPVRTLVETRKLPSWMYFPASLWGLLYCQIFKIIVFPQFWTPPIQTMLLCWIWIYSYWVPFFGRLFNMMSGCV